MECFPVFSLSKFTAYQGMTVGHTLGGGCGHIKDFGLSPFIHQSKFCKYEGLLGRHVLCLMYAGENTDIVMQLFRKVSSHTLYIVCTHSNKHA